MKNLIIFIVFFLLSYSIHSQTQKEVKKYVISFLSKHDPRIGSDSIGITEDAYHVLLLQKIKSKQISIYKFAFNSLHSSNNFILIIDNMKNTWVVLGQNDLSADIKYITDFFSKTHKVKKSVIIKCYSCLTDNFQNQRKWEKVEIKEK